MRIARAGAPDTLAVVRPARPRHAIARLLAAVAAAAILLPARAGAVVPYPTSMAAAGDSITRGYNTGSLPFTDNAAGSWATGTTTSVQSHYARLLALQPAISGKVTNVAKTAAKSSDLARQLGLAAPGKPGYLTILIGANDACAGSEAQMTPVATFRSNVTGALATFTAASPETRIAILSIPNIQQLWSLLKGSAAARTAWGVYGICQSMLANPTSTAQADADRRARVLQRVRDYNDVLATACAAYAQCRWDGGAVFSVAFTTSDVSTRDYFHPSLAGQAKLASVSWAAGFWGP